ncbi:hypothetical protein SAMN05421809_3691 [Natronorubrum daqingense]|nr:hypothetical protein SAMN05421809_3691 [Natronorubrum daqingense]
MSSDDTDRKLPTDWDLTKTGWTIEDCVEEVEEMGDDPENQFYYTTYSDVFHTTPKCPHIQDSENLHVTGLRSDLNGTLMAGENRVAGPTDEHCDLRECGWCSKNGGYHRMERTQDANTDGARGDPHAE